MINDWCLDEGRIKNGIKVDPEFVYESSTNTEWMTKADLQIWLKENLDKIGKI